MKHPQAKCPEHLIPLFAAVLKNLEVRVADVREVSSLYICYALLEVDSELVPQAQIFMDASLNPGGPASDVSCLEDWLVDHEDATYTALCYNDMPKARAYANGIRIEWLKFLTGEPQYESLHC